MNHFVPSWNVDSSNSTQKMPTSGDDDLVELLWKNGHVVMQSQTSRKAQITNKTENYPKSTNSVQEDEAPSWFQYPFEDSLEKDLFSEFFSEIPINTQDKSSKELLMPPPKSSSYDEVTRISKQPRTDMIERAMEGSSVTVGSKIFRSNPQYLKKDLDLQGEKLQLNGKDGNLSCSSGRSGCSFGRVGNGSTGNGSTGNGNKRKVMDLEETASHSEDIENESIGVNKPDKRHISTRRSRAAEVHNLSERRRRDRINEKMKALQELIPHCNKTDKASMLDEAIEYLKTLQLQVQMMWMSGGMGPMMMPSVHQYMSRIGLGVPPVPMARLPFMNQPVTATCPTNQNLLYSAIPFANQMPSVIGLNHMQLPPNSQGLNFYPYGAQIMHHQTTVAPNNIVPPPNVVIPPECEQTSKLSGLTRENL